MLDYDLNKVGWVFVKENRISYNVSYTYYLDVMENCGVLIKESPTMNPHPSQKSEFYTEIRQSILDTVENDKDVKKTLESLKIKLDLCRSLLKSGEHFNYVDRDVFTKVDIDFSATATLVDSGDYFTELIEKIEKIIPLFSSTHKSLERKIKIDKILD